LLPVDERRVDLGAVAGTNTASPPPASMTRSSVAGDDGDQVVAGVAGVAGPDG
jgi:hypothetical protein